MEQERSFKSSIFFHELFQIVIATSDHNMVDSENSETSSSEATLKKQTVRFAELPRGEDDVEEVD